MNSGATRPEIGPLEDLYEEVLSMAQDGPLSWIMPGTDELNELSHSVVCAAVRAGMASLLWPNHPEHAWPS